MAMRSQVYAWDLYKGTAVTGQPLTVQLESNTLSPIKTLDVDVGGWSWLVVLDVESVQFIYEKCERKYVR